MHDRTIAFLTANMKEMEIELRAQSIALDALGQGIIEISGLQDALAMARRSEAMLAFVEQKYERMREILPLVESAKTEKEIARLFESCKPAGLMQ